MDASLNFSQIISAYHCLTAAGQYGRFLLSLHCFTLNLSKIGASNFPSVASPLFSITKSQSVTSSSPHSLSASSTPAENTNPREALEAIV